jgi:type I restriction enzyme S subunit
VEVTPKLESTNIGREIFRIQSSDLKKEQLYNVQPSKFITDDAVKNSATKLVPKNSIAIVTRVGVGKLALLPFEYATSQDFLLSNQKLISGSAYTARIQCSKRIK